MRKNADCGILMNDPLVYGALAYLRSKGKCNRNRQFWCWLTSVGFQIAIMRRWKSSEVRIKSSKIRLTVANSGCKEADTFIQFSCHSCPAWTNAGLPVSQKSVSGEVHKRRGGNGTKQLSCLNKCCVEFGIYCTNAPWRSPSIESRNITCDLRSLKR